MPMCLYTERFGTLDAITPSYAITIECSQLGDDLRFSNPQEARIDGSGDLTIRKDLYFYVPLDVQYLLAQIPTQLAQ